MKTFTVISASEFLNSGPPIGSVAERDLLRREEKEKQRRNQKQQQQIDEWQKRRERMTPRQVLQDEQAMLIEIRNSEQQAMDACEREYQKLLRGTAHGSA